MNEQLVIAVVVLFVVMAIAVIMAVFAYHFGWVAGYAAGHRRGVEYARTLPIGRLKEMEITSLGIEGMVMLEDDVKITP